MIKLLTLLALFFGFLILIIIVLSVYICIISPFIVIKPYRKTREFYTNLNLPSDPDFYNLDFLEADIKTFDSKILKGWFIPAKDPKGTLIILHGISDSKASQLEFAYFFQQKGYNILLYDLRGHGYSEGDYCTYGYYEKLDVKSVVDYLFSLKNIKIGKIGIMGISLGGAISLQSLEVENRIACCVSEASFSNLRNTIYDYQKRGIFSISVFLRSIIIRRIQKVGNFIIDEVSPLKAVKNSKVPILFLHGSNDSRISIKYLHQLYNSASSIKEKFIIEDADHNDLREVGGVAYKYRILEFLNKYLAV